MKSPFERLLMGFWSPLVGIKMIFTSRKYFVLSIFPFLIGVCFTVLAFFVVANYLTPFIESWFSGNSFEIKIEWLLKIFSTVMFVIYWLTATLFNFLIGYLCMILFAGPFYALIAEEVFVSEGLVKAQRSSVGLIMKMFFLGFMKVLLFVGIGLFCFILAFIPGFNLLSPFIVFSLVAFDCTDYAFEVDLLGLRKRFRFFFAHLFEFAGLTGAIFLTTLLPGSFFVLLPAFICGATKMYIQLTHKLV